jgi:hypothetical protein
VDEVGMAGLLAAMDWRRRRRGSWSMVAIVMGGGAGLEDFRPGRDGGDEGS